MSSSISLFGSARSDPSREGLVCKSGQLAEGVRPPESKGRQNGLADLPGSPISRRSERAIEQQH